MTYFYSVDLDSAAEVVESLTSADGELAEVISDLRWRMTRLHSTWSGTAAGAHLVAHQDWAASYAEMQEALATMRRAVRSAAQNYSSAADANASMWSSVR